MTPRPLHRWKSFWLGVLVLTFLGWGWVRSMVHNEWVMYGSSLGARWLSVGQSDGTVEFGYGGGIGAAPRFYWQHLSESWPSSLWPWFPRVVHVWGDFDDRWGIVVAPWFLIILFLIPWTVFLIWRIRRIGRLAAGT